MMLTFLGKKYITDKEAAAMFCYSLSWFQAKRHKKEGPPYIRVGKAKIYYELEKLENWFRENTREM